MDYKQLEKMISTYNEYVNAINSIMDDEIANNKIENAPYEAFELIKTTDENPNHLPYLYLRFVYLPYKVNSTVESVVSSNKEQQVSEEVNGSVE